MQDEFYEKLVGFKDFSTSMDLSLYEKIPDDWYVVVTDVKGSTLAIEEGRYKEVNAMAVASIVAIINSLKPLKVPFVFGGDGASALLPSSVIQKVKPALVAAQNLSKEKFNLELRIGLVPITKIRELNEDVLVAKFQPYPYYNQAMFTGGGLSLAEGLIKEKTLSNPYLVDTQEEADSSIFDGFECRWNEIPSPKEENVTLLVQAVDKEINQNELYGEILQKIESIYENENNYHPIREEGMSLTKQTKFLKIESLIRTAFLSRYNFLSYILKLFSLSVFGKYFIDFKKYKEYFIHNTDYRKFDDALRMVISGSKQHREELKEFLEAYHREGKIVYGLHISDSSLVTCVITNYETDHIHLLDGNNGGYAMAAKALKAQLV